MPSSPGPLLATLTLTVDFAGIVPIGMTAAGFRAIAPVTGGTLTGEGIAATVRAGHDWFVTAPDGSLLIDVRLTLDGADGPAYLSYTGAMRGPAGAMARFRKGDLLDPADYSLTMTPCFEGGGAIFAPLTGRRLIGVGTQTLSGPIYRIHAAT